MATQFNRACPVLLAAIGWMWTAGATAAQTPDSSSIAASLAAVKERVPVGSDVYVTDSTGATIKGRLDELTASTMRIRVRAEIRSVATSDILRIQWQQPDSLLSGVLIGAGIGAIPGPYWLAVDPNECHGMCPEEYALVAAGAVIGGLIDHHIKRKVTVYERRPVGTRTTSLTIHPLFTRGRIGGHVVLNF